MKNISNEVKLLMLLMLPVFLVMLLHYYYTGFVIYNDGINYYNYLRSAAIDKDLDFLNEWQHYNSSFSKFSSVSRGINFIEVRTPKGYVDNIHLIGNAIMWLPFFFTAHLLTLFLNAAGANIEANGYTFFYEAGIGLATIIYGFLGMLLIYKFCRKWFDKKTSFLATLGMFYGTATFWYFSVEPSMAHINSLFLGALFVYFWHSTLGKRTKLQWLFLGLLLGLLYLVRQQDILFILLPGFEILKNLFAKFEFNRIKGIVLEQIVFTTGILLALIPQIFVWKKFYGKYLVFSYGLYSAKTGLWHWTFPQIIPIFFSTQYGMLLRAPFLLFSLIGLALFARRIRGVAAYFLIIVCAEIIVTSAWSSWNSGYGLRFLLGMGVFFTLGAAEMIARLSKKFSSKFAYALVALFVAINFINMVLFLFQ